MRIKSLIHLATLLAALVPAAAPWAGELHQAAREGDSAAAERLIASGADVQEIDSDTALTPLVEAALAGNEDVVVLLIRKGADPRGRDGKGFTALHAGAHMGHVEVVELLLEQGVDLDDQENIARITPLHAAAERDHRDVARVLLVKGAEVDLKTGSGHTPAFMAVLNDHPEMVKLLREHGADCSHIRSKKLREYCMNPGN